MSGIQISYRDFGGIVRADLPLVPGKITLVVGRNNQGKSALLRGAGAILTNTRMPNGEPMTLAEGYIRRGAQTGSITLKGDETFRDSQMTWKSGTVEHEGPVEPLSLMAAGFQSFADLAPSDRSQMLIKLLDARPTKVAIADTLLDIFGWAHDSKETAGFIRDLSSLGWEKLTDEAETKQRNLKGQWCGLAGKKSFPVKEAPNFRPDGWDESLKVKTPEAYEQEIKIAQTQRDEALKHRAVDQAEQDRLKELAADVDDLTAGKTAAQDAVTVAEQNLSTARAYLSELPRPGAAQVIRCCPYEDCGREIRVLGDMSLAVPAEPTDPGKEKEIQTRHYEQQQRVSELERDLSKALTSYHQVNATLEQCTEASRKLAKMAATPRTSTFLDLPTCEKALQDAQNKARLLGLYRQTQDLSVQVDQQIKLVAKLKPEGLRLTALIEKLQGFNQTALLPLCQVAGWAPVRITPTMTIMWGESPYSDASESEQWRADLVIQIAIAGLKKEPYIVVDRADVLEPSNRPPLMKLLAGLTLGVLMAMSVDEPGKVPDLAKVKAGVTYWVDQGVARPVGELVSA